MTLLDACREVMRDPAMKDRYPDGLNSGDVLTEIRAKHGADAFPLVSIIDVANEMRSFFGRPGGDPQVTDQGAEARKGGGS